MKRSQLSLILLLLVSSIMAQVPQNLSYQAVMRDADENLVKEQSIGVKVSILKGETPGTAVAVYAETHTVSTNANGLLSLEIGSGNVVLGNMADIEWHDGPFYIKSESDLNGGSDYTISGVSQLMSVPYAFYAKEVDNRDDADADPANELQSLSIDGNQLSISNGNTVYLPMSIGNIGEEPGGGGSSYAAGRAGSIQFSDGNILAASDSLYWNNAEQKLGIGTSNPQAQLHVAATENNAGNVAFTGTVNYTDPKAPPVTGPGTRMMWYPEKAAFRAGTVMGTAWNKDQIGIASVAFGENAIAEGRNSMALGHLSEARQDYSIALGLGANAFAEHAVALGYNTKASGESSTALGFNTIASGHGSMAFGLETNALGYGSTAIGLNTTASDSAAVAMGGKTTASEEYSTAMGYATEASGKYAIAMGQESKATGTNSIAIGYKTEAKSYYSIALGYQTTAHRYSTAMGNETNALGNTSTAMGGSTTASGDYSTTMGNETTASGDYSTSMGHKTEASGEYSTAMGYVTKASGRFSSSIGLYAEATNTGSTAIGYGAKASGNSSMAMGVFTEASGVESTTMGASITAPSYRETAIGTLNTQYTPASEANWVANDRLFVIGNGKNVSNRSNALTILKNGNTGIGTDTPSALLHLSDDEGEAVFKDGKVGIGTDTPAEKLHIEDSDGDVKLRLTSGANNHSWLTFYAGNTYKGGLGYDASDDQLFFTHNSTNMVFESGKLGIGTISPAEELHLVDNDGDVKIRLASGANNHSWLTFYAGNTYKGGLGYDAPDDHLFFAHNGKQIVFKDGCIGLGGLTNPTNALHLPNSTVHKEGSAQARAWYDYSDGRLKSKRQALAYGLAEVLQMKPLSYFHHNSKVENNSLQILANGENNIGFIAQDMYNIIPEVVSAPENEATELWSMDYERLVPVLVKAMQEQQEMIRKLESENKALASEKEAIIARLDKLEKMIENINTK